MSTRYIPPQISVAFDMDTDEFRLMATSYSVTQPVGERIFRAEPWPEVAFVHPTQAEAEHDAQVLREYLEECASGKRKDKPTVSGRGWWQD